MEMAYGMTVLINKFIVPHNEDLPQAQLFSSVIPGGSLANDLDLEDIFPEFRLETPACTEQASANSIRHLWSVPFHNLLHIREYEIHFWSCPHHIYVLGSYALVVQVVHIDSFCWREAFYGE